MIHAGLYGIEQQLTPPMAADFNIFSAPAEVLSSYQKLPTSLREAMAIASSSGFIREHLSDLVISAYCKDR